MDHLCLSIRAPDLGSLAASLRARGVAVEGEPVMRRGAFGEGPSLYIRDPDGYRVELKPAP
jgi:extradiol dioxygenase family protein